MSLRSARIPFRVATRGALPGVTTRLSKLRPLSLGFNTSRRRQWTNRTLWVCCASETTERKLIARSDIPVVYPREDFTLQLFRWAKIDAEANGLQNFGAAFDVRPTLKDPDANEEEAELWGFDAYILRDGETVCQVGVYMDRETVEKHEFVGIGEDRFPVNEGRVEIVEGKALEIWKIGEESIDEDTRDVLRLFCKALSSAIDTYSSFGSCFADDAT